MLITRFLRAPAFRKRIAVEAVCELIRARILTLRRAAVYTNALGNLAEAGLPETSPQQREDQAAEIGALIASAANVLPFRAKCLQQAIAVRRMLDRRQIPATVHLGVARSHVDRADADRAAHAWVLVGSRVVSGEDQLERFAVVARFT